MLQGLQYGSSQGCGIIGIKLLASQSVVDGEPRIVADLLGHHVVGCVGLADALGEELFQEEPGQNRHDQKDKSGNGENKFCLQTHGGYTVFTNEYSGRRMVTSSVS